MDDDQKTQKTGLPPLGKGSRPGRRSSEPPHPPVETTRDGEPPEFDESDPEESLDDSGPTFVGEHPQGAAQQDTKVQAYPDDEIGEPVPVLIVNSPQGTSEVELRDEKIVIGRAPECDVVIADQLVSRSHAILEQLAEGWYLVDQGSGNGTFLNGKRIDKAVLYDSDVIQIGDAEITFSDSQAPKAPSPPRPAQVSEASTSTVTEGTSLTRTSGTRAFAQKNRWTIIVGGVVLFIIVAWAALKITDPGRHEPTAAELAAKEQKRRVKKAETSFRTVKSLVKAGKWEEAQALIAQVAMVIGERPVVQQYQATIKLESAALKDIRQAELQLAAEDFPGAITLLLRIPADSMYFEKAKELKSTAELKARELKLTRIKQAYDRQDFPAVVKLAEEVLVAEPDNQVALELKRQAEAEINKPPPRRRRRRKKPQVVRTPPPRSRALLSGSALEAYRQGDLDQALAIGSSSGTSAEGMTKLRRLSSLYSLGSELARNPAKTKQSEKALLQAVKLDRALGGGRGEMTKKIRHKLAGVYFFRAVDAHNRKKYPEAYKSYNLSLEYRPDLKQAKKRLKDLEKQAQKLYDTAYVIKLNNPEKAISLCKTVLRMVRKDAYAYGRCKKLITKIQGPTSSSGSDEGF